MFSSSRSLNFGIVLVFLLLLPFIFKQCSSEQRQQIQNAQLRSIIVQALVNSQPYKIMVAEFFAVHDFLPVDDYADELNQRYGNQFANVKITKDSNIVLRIVDAKNTPLGAITLYSEADYDTGRVRWTCQSNDFNDVLKDLSICTTQSVQ